ncbi:MAG: RNA polymerase sigma factor [Solirubrobacteraceae bacterium]
MDDRDVERLFTEHAQALFGFLAYRTGDRTLAEDLVADTFERAMRGRGRFDRRRGSETTWLYTIALNLLRDHERRRGAEARALARHGGASEGQFDPALDQVADRDQAMRAVATLPEPERDVIALRFGAGLTVPEIAKLTGEQLTTVEGRVYRALRRLRDALGA